MSLSSDVAVTGGVGVTVEIWRRKGKTVDLVSMVIASGPFCDDSTERVLLVGFLGNMN